MSRLPVTSTTGDIKEVAKSSSDDFSPPSYDIAGNAKSETKERVEQWIQVLSTAGFGTRTGKHLKLTELSIRPTPDEPARQEARVVLEMPVTEDMLDTDGKIHGGCIIYLVDICSTLPIAAISHAEGGSGSPGVSQNINTNYHAPASLGDKLRLINTSTTVDGRTASARIEIWDVTHRRLVATATQVKMEASRWKL
ncbi:HotDog domain-containing protein [Phlebopus sp. FC_14]|nr:HotDog domain-containing protein [Phlebopus sp. FC_14]